MPFKKKFYCVGAIRRTKNKADFFFRQSLRLGSCPHEPLIKFLEGFYNLYVSFFNLTIRILPLLSKFISQIFQKGIIIFSHLIESCRRIQIITRICGQLPIFCTWIIMCVIQIHFFTNLYSIRHFGSCGHEPRRGFMGAALTLLPAVILAFALSFFYTPSDKISVFKAQHFPGIRLEFPRLKFIFNHLKRR